MEKLYDSSLLINFIHGIVHETTAPYYLAMNGKAERKNRTLTELVVVIMMKSGAAPHWWGKFY